MKQGIGFFLKKNRHFFCPTEEVQRALLGQRVLGVVEGLEVKLEEGRLTEIEFKFDAQT